MLQVGGLPLVDGAVTAGQAVLGGVLNGVHDGGIALVEGNNPESWKRGKIRNEKKRSYQMSPPQK